MATADAMIYATALVACVVTTDTHFNRLPGITLLDE
jgi:hypothetical protein